MEENNANADKEIKEDILRALEGVSIMLCPHCKNRVFMRRGIARVEITDDGDSLLDTIIDGVEGYVYRCAKCDEEVTEDEMIRTTKLVFNKED